MDRCAFAITGLIDPTGVGGDQAAGDADWTLRCVLSAWRDPEGVVRPRPLELQRALSQDDLDAWAQRLPGDAVVRVRVRFENPASAELLEILGGAGDVELERLAEAQKVPRTFEAEPFGTFTEDRRVRWFEASTTWGASEVRVALTPDADGDVRRPLDVARRLWARQPRWDARIREELAHLTIEDAEPVLARLTLQTVVVDPDGRWTFWHGDGGMFFGRSVFVSGRLDRGPLETGIVGGGPTGPTWAAPGRRLPTPRWAAAGRGSSRSCGRRRTETGDGRRPLHGRRAWPPAPAPFPSGALRIPPGPSAGGPAFRPPSAG